MASNYKQIKSHLNLTNSITINFCNISKMMWHHLIRTDLTHHFTLLIVFEKRRKKLFETRRNDVLGTLKKRNGITFNNFTVVPSIERESISLCLPKQNKHTHTHLYQYTKLSHMETFILEFWSKGQNEREERGGGTKRRVKISPQFFYFGAFVVVVVELLSSIMMHIKR